MLLLYWVWNHKKYSYQHPIQTIRIIIELLNIWWESCIKCWFPCTKKQQTIPHFCYFLLLKGRVHMHTEYKFMIKLLNRDLFEYLWYILPNWKSNSINPHKLDWNRFLTDCLWTCWCTDQSPHDLRIYHNDTSCRSCYLGHEDLTQSVIVGRFCLRNIQMIALNPDQHIGNGTMDVFHQDFLVRLQYKIPGNYVFYYHFWKGWNLGSLLSRQFLERAWDNT